VQESAQEDLQRTHGVVTWQRRLSSDESGLLNYDIGAFADGIPVFHIWFTPYSGSGVGGAVLLQREFSGPWMDVICMITSYYISS
jgi:hypothetical protein